MNEGKVKRKNRGKREWTGEIKELSSHGKSWRAMPREKAGSMTHSLASLDSEARHLFTYHLAISSPSNTNCQD